MKLKIVSDGTKIGTKLIDEDTSEMICKVQSVEWAVDANEWVAYTTIKLIDVPVQIEMPAQIHIAKYNPNTDNLEISTNESECQNVKVNSNGYVHETQVTTDNGDKLSAVQKIKWTAIAGEDEPELIIERLDF